MLGSRKDQEGKKACKATTMLLRSKNSFGWPSISVAFGQTGATSPQQSSSHFANWWPVLTQSGTESRETSKYHLGLQEQILTAPVTSRQQHALMSPRNLQRRSVWSLKTCLLCGGPRPVVREDEAILTSLSGSAPLIQSHDPANTF